MMKDTAGDARTLGKDAVQIRVVSLSQLRNHPAASHTPAPPTWVVIAAVAILLLLLGAILLRRLR